MGETEYEIELDLCQARTSPHTFELISYKRIAWIFEGTPHARNVPLFVPIFRIGTMC
jgi:hypothetical protein